MYKYPTSFSDISPQNTETTAMGNGGNNYHSFSLNFEKVNSLKFDTQFGNIFFRDVKVANRCLVVSDAGSNRVLFIDLKYPHNIIQTLNTPDQPHYLCIEKVQTTNIGKKAGCWLPTLCDEYLYISFRFYIYKFHIETLLEGKKIEPIWRSGEFTDNLMAQQGSKPKLNQFHYPQGMVLCKHGDVFKSINQSENVLLVGDQTQFEVKILECKDGKVIKRLDTTPRLMLKGGGPMCIEIDSKGRIITTGQELLLFESLESNSKGKLCCSETSFSFTSGIVIDRGNGNILICDQGNKRIVVLNEDFQFIKDFSLNLVNPSAICLDERSGFVYISDQSNIHILK